MSKLMRHVRLSLVAVLTSGVAALLGTANSALAQEPIQQIVVFGDSLSDTGNGFVLLKAAGLEPQSTPPDYSLSPLLVPSAPYARGGHHVTNGATWIEQLARPLGLASSVLPAFRAPNPDASNFAIGTARARDDGTNPSAADIVGAFLLRSGGVARPDALYVMELGGNDVRDGFAVATVGQDPAPILDAAAKGIAGAVGALYAAGARNFLIWNVPDIGKTPAVGILESQFPGTAEAATNLTLLFNNLYLPTELAGVSVLPGINLVLFDSFALINAIVADPAQFGLTNVLTACVTPEVPPFFCQNPDEYLYWDGIHPTKAGHAIVASTVAQLLGM
ncbi:MAG TPA: SGNH/GDSL hydrolase family protein [Vicinamibacterales bacterium]|nr:SGNH/GDSL hydrolase family protein [Vicinamibacterales bacterium]